MLRGTLDLGLDGVVASSLLKSTGEVDNGAVGGSNSEGHAGELSIEGRDDLADGLGGASG